MPESQIPDEVRRFVTENVRSVAQLEILLLLTNSPERSWSVAELYHEVLSNEQLVEQTLAWFCQRGLAARSDGRHRFSGTESQLGVVNQLAVLYRDRPARVVQALYEPKVSEIDEFARAFKIRKDNK